MIGLLFLYLVVGLVWGYVLASDFKPRPVNNFYEFTIQNRIVTPMRSKPPVAPKAPDPKPEAPQPPHFNPEGVTNKKLVSQVLEAKKNLNKMEGKK